MIRLLLLAIMLTSGCGPDCKDQDPECKRVEGIRTIENYPEGTTLNLPGVCNIHIANTEIGDQRKRAALFSRIASLGCTVRGIFQAGFQVSDKESWYKDSWVIFENHRASFWPTPTGVTEANWLKGKFPYLEPVKACSAYTIETAANWGTIVLDSRPGCDLQPQLDELRLVLDHGYERLDIVVEGSISSIQTMVEDTIDPPRVTVFNGSLPGYSRRSVRDVTYISSGMAGPERSSCPDNVDSCYPDTSFVVCTIDECKAVSLYSEVDSF